MAEVDHTHVSIRFVGNDLDPKKVADLLGFVEVSSTETSVNRLKSGRVVWGIAFKNDEPLPLENKIEALLAQFTNEINVWKLVTENVSVDIFCGLFLESWNQGFELSPNIMKELSDRQLKIGFDIYAPTDTWYE